MSQAKVSLPFDLIDDPRVKPDHTHLWTRLEVLRLRQQSDVVGITEGYKILCHLSGFMTKKVRRLLDDLSKLGYLHLKEHQVVTLLVGAKYPGTSLSRKEPIPTEPIPLPTEPENSPESGSELKLEQIGNPLHDDTKQCQCGVTLTVDNHWVDTDGTESCFKCYEIRHTPKAIPEEDLAGILLKQPDDWLATAMCAYPKGWDGLREWWNQIAGECGLPLVKNWSKKRKKGVLQRLATKGFPGPDDLYASIKAQPFCHKWLAFDWIFAWEGNWVKIDERNYEQMGDGGNGRRKTAAEENEEKLRAVYAEGGEDADKGRDGGADGSDDIGSDRREAPAGGQVG